MELINIIKIVVVFIIGGVAGYVANILINYFIDRVEYEEDNKGKDKPLLNKYIKQTYKCGCRRKGIYNIPIFGYLLSKGKCKECNKKISKQYLLVELLMACLFSLIIIFAKQPWLISFLFCLVTIALVIVSFVDLNTYEIPIELNYFILAIGVIITIIDYKNLISHIVGLILVSGFIAILIYATNGRAMGGGDCKLMATCGLVLGWKNILLAFMIGCILGSIIHIVRIKISGEEKMLAFGPYLAAGIYISYIWGDYIINMYMSLYR